jgi:hypothetical protein
MGIDLHLSTCVDTQSPKYLEMAQGHISLSDTTPNIVIREIANVTKPSESRLEGAG